MRGSRIKARREEKRLGLPRAVISVSVWGGRGAGKPAVNTPLSPAGSLPCPGSGSQRRAEQSSCSPGASAPDGGCGEKQGNRSENWSWALERWRSLVVLGGPPCGVRGEVGMEPQVVCVEVGTGVEEWKVRITTLLGGFLWRGWGDMVLERDGDRGKHLLQK